MTLTTTREATDAATVQSQLQAPPSTPPWPRRARARSRASSTCAPATSACRRATRARARSAAGRARPNWCSKAGTSPRITQTAGTHPTLTVGNVGFGLSREQRAKVEAEAQTLAIDNFKQKAGELAKGFGFGGYTLREVSVNAQPERPDPPAHDGDGGQGRWPPTRRCRSRPARPASWSTSPARCSSGSKSRRCLTGASTFGAVIIYDAARPSLTSLRAARRASP